MSNSNEKSDWGNFVKWGAVIFGAAAVGAAGATYLQNSQEKESQHAYEAAKANANAGSSTPNKRKVQLNECAICQNTEEDDCMVFIEPCRHAYHKSCLEQWEEQNLRNSTPHGKQVMCPCCRQQYNVAPSKQTTQIQMNLDRCCVCSDDGFDHVKIILKRCHHVFHRSCFDEVNSNNVYECPKCKTYQEEIE